MPLTTSQLISGLGAGQSLAEIAGAAGVSVEEARKVWQNLIRARVPPSSASLRGSVSAPVEVVRDSYGVPHVYAQSEPDLFFGLGFAMAQDRSWQMDYLRRKATGRLAEIEFFGLPQDELVTYRGRVAAVTPAEVARVAERLMPAPEAVAIVVVGKAAEIRDSLAARFTPLETMAASECENLSVPVAKR